MSLASSGPADASSEDAFLSISPPSHVPARPLPTLPLKKFPRRGLRRAARVEPSGKAARGSRRLQVFALVLLAALYLGTTAGPAIFDQSEGQYAGAAREMLDRDYAADTAGQLWRGHWLVPTNDGIPRLQKPPLIYWFEALSLGLCGVNERGARLPNALACLLWFFAVYLLGCRLGGPALGATAALILGTMTGAFIFGHMIMPEPFLATFLTLTFWCFASACQQPARAGRWMTLAWVFMALGSFTKGLHGAGYPLAVAACVAWCHPPTRLAWQALLRPRGPLLFLLLVAPWYAVMEARFPGFLRDQFFNEQLGHVFNHRFPPDSERVSLGVFWVQHLVFFLPWTFFVPAAWLAWRRGRGGSMPHSADRFSPRSALPAEAAARAIPGAWLAVTAVSILFSALQDYYTMTAWAAVALWLARPWAASEPSSARQQRLPAATLPVWAVAGPGWALLLLGLSVGGTAVWLGWQVMSPASPAALAASNTIGDRDSILETIRAFPVGAWRLLLPLLWGTAGTLVAGGVATVWLATRRQFAATVPAVAAAMAATLACAAAGMCAMEDQVSLKRVAQEINHRAVAGALVVCQGDARDNPSAFFYLNHSLHWLDSSPANEFATRERKIGSELFLSAEGFDQRWAAATAAGGQVFLICEETALAGWRDRLALTPAQAQPIARSGSRVAICNR